MPDISIDFAELDALYTALDQTKTEFDDATTVSGGLQDAVGRPDERGDLASKLDEFESAWNNTRDDLVENLEKVRGRLGGVIDGWKQLDIEAAAALTPEPSQGPAVGLGSARAV